MERKLQIERDSSETAGQPLARTVTDPACLSASVLTICQNVHSSQIDAMVNELKKQTIAVQMDDLSRMESMLVAQAHTLDGLFAKLTSEALTAERPDVMERYMRLALKSQSQARTTLQTLAELKMPKQVAFVRQANIGNQVQINNDAASLTRARKNRNEPNKLLEGHHAERLDTRTTGTAGRDDQAMAALEKQHRAGKRQR